MTPPSDRERILCAMFESFCVAAIRNFGRNLRRAMRNHQKYDGTGEVSVEYLIGLLSSEDVYASEQFVLDVDGLPCVLENELLYNALLSFLAAFNQLLNGKDALLEDCRIMQDHLTACTALDAELDELLREIAVVTELTQRCIQENARSAQSQEEYAERYNGYVARYDAAKAKLDAFQKEKAQRLAKADAIGGFMFELSEYTEAITEFNEGLWLAVVEKATAYHDGRLVFTFQNGIEIEG